MCGSTPSHRRSCARATPRRCPSRPVIVCPNPPLPQLGAVQKHPSRASQDHQTAQKILCPMLRVIVFIYYSRYLSRVLAALARQSSPARPKSSISSKPRRPAQGCLLDSQLLDISLLAHHLQQWRNPRSLAQPDPVQGFAAPGSRRPPTARSGLAM